MSYYNLTKLASDKDNKSLSKRLADATIDNELMRNNRGKAALFSAIASGAGIAALRPSSLNKIDPEYYKINKRLHQTLLINSLGQTGYHTYKYLKDRNQQNQ